MPKHLLLSLMYGMVLTPSFINIFVMSDHSYDLFVMHVLLFFAIVVLGRFLKREVHLTALTIIEILFSAWICMTYGNLMFILALTPLFVYLLLPNITLRWMMFGFHLIAVNYALLQQPPVLIAASNIFLVLIATLVSLLQQMDRRKNTALLMYDELRKKHYELDESKNRLVLFTKQVEGFAQAEERSRISQQLHDDVGHRLIRTKMMMEAALQIMPNDQNKGMLMMREIRDQLATGLDEMRATVRRLRPSTQVTGIHSLSRLLEEIGRETGIRTALNIEGNPLSLYPSQEIILYKNAREAVTNALRHGQAESIEITILYTDSEVRMSISNDGTLPEGNLQHMAGLGLAGMKERCTLAGGYLEFSIQSPFTIITRLPITQHQKIQ
ncbi:sensor histidine kinase [Paenibacillus segetis]|uniref:histidine kinase n=1 Tax=Paenibacillus segetis TaxID=1325360 RepID=A0ABQ1YUK4_9BACL|nr:sensor histidine kinase [Paenibacillus segetis]GGH37649.1 histidine kinase [Paenibacillus segetis]